MTFTDKQQKELKEDLLIMKQRLEEWTRNEKVHDIDTDEVSFADNHLADAATKYVDRQTQIAESNLHGERLNEVNQSLDQIKKGTYGICVDTGKEIPFERLKAIPYAKRTIEAEENHQKQPPANEGEDTTRMVKQKEEVEDSRNRTLERIEEEHD